MCLIIKATNMHKKLKVITNLFCVFALLTSYSYGQINQNVITKNHFTDPSFVFLHPPEFAKPGVLWMWMGSNLSKDGITKDLEALKKAGFNRTTMFSLADITTPWAAEIKNSPTPEIISWTEPWWKLVRHAAEESKRLHMDFGMFNGPSYESSGGTWITPELSMQEICWSENLVIGNSHVSLQLKRPQVDPRANQPFPVYNPVTGLVEKPEIEARKTYYKDIAVLALPANGVVPENNVIDLSKKMTSDGMLEWDAPEGKWTIYRFGHTTMGALIQPAQWQATGFECDKMSAAAVEFHLNHVISETKKHLGDLIGTGFSHIHFDSYEAGTPTWTPKMREEFLNRRGYDATPYLVTFAGRIINSQADSIKFKNDFDATIKDLYRDIYFKTIAKKLKEANLDFLCEPYGGPWRQDEIMPLVKNVMTEFWTTNGIYTPFELDPTVAALRKSGQNIIEAEAFTGMPDDSKWSETPSWIKPIGDAAFCAGVNRMVLHRFVQQPWSDKFKPGATMGQWGTHFDRTQTWWNNGMPAMVKYWQRCQALLQWGNIVPSGADDFAIENIQGKPLIKSIHRKSQNVDIYFVANTSHNKGIATCIFQVAGMQPELWDPVTGNMRSLASFKEKGGKTLFDLELDDAQSYFVVFRNKYLKVNNTLAQNFPSSKEIFKISSAWKVSFDSAWGGPINHLVFSELEDWTKNLNPGVKYYSGTAIYQTTFDFKMDEKSDAKSSIYIDLGEVKHVASVRLNSKDLGVLWTAPWSVKIPAGLLKEKNNKLIIEVSNVWANRLIGDEQEPDDCEWIKGHMGDYLPGHKAGSYLKQFPYWFVKKQPRPSKGRYCFTTWKYFTKESPLVSSGLIGPVRIILH